jgi:hypothetical protein
VRERLHGNTSNVVGHGAPPIVGAGFVLGRATHSIYC